LSTSADAISSPLDREATVERVRHASTVNSLLATNPPDILTTWLRLATSLTAKLAAQFGASPGLILLEEGLESGRRWECEALNAEKSIFARHIALTVNEEPVVLARTVTLPGAGMDALTELRSRPLAELLFEDPEWRRGTAVQYLHLEDGSPGRGCHWHNNKLQAGLIVQEFFLPRLSTLLSQ
jgi:chorismate-pyruvate lyase